MLAYAIATPPCTRTLNALEMVMLLKVSGEELDGFREHVIFSVVRSTELCEHEIAGHRN